MYYSSIPCRGTELRYNVIYPLIIVIDLELLAKIGIVALSANN